MGRRSIKSASDFPLLWQERLLCVFVALMVFPCFYLVQLDRVISPLEDFAKNLEPVIGIPVVVDFSPVLEALQPLFLIGSILFSLRVYCFCATLRGCP